MLTLGNWGRGFESHSLRQLEHFYTSYRFMEELYFEIFESLPSQGPGDDESTRKAFQKLAGLPKHPKIMDVGCGTGILAVAAVKMGVSQVLGVDLDPDSIEIARQNSLINGVSENIHLGLGSVGEISQAATIRVCEPVATW